MKLRFWLARVDRARARRMRFCASIRPAARCPCRPSSRTRRRAAPSCRPTSPGGAASRIAPSTISRRRSTPPIPTLPRRSRPTTPQPPGRRKRRRGFSRRSTRSDRSPPTGNRTTGRCARRASRTYYGNNILGGQVSYEIDIWGRVRDLVSGGEPDRRGERGRAGRSPARTARRIGARLCRPARPRRPGEAHLGHDRHLSLRARADEVPAPGADRIAGRRRPRADPAELGRGARVGNRAPAGGARECDCGPGRKAGGVLFRREGFGCLFRCRSGRAPSRPRCCGGGRTSPNRNA